MARTRRARPTVTPGAIISSVEVAYLRSFYKFELSHLNGLNILFGENDTGKSNLMRALNLFFNEEVSDEYGFDFDIDFSAKRLREAQGESDIRKFSYVKIWFRSPPEHKNSLGDEFYVKRTWSQAYGEEYNQDCSSHLKSSAKQQSLTKFLNKIEFTYIPAVKDRSVYSKLLVKAYEAIANSAGFPEALTAFTAEIRNQTNDLSEKLNRSLSMDSALAPPTDLGQLFASLDFETLLKGGSRMSLIRQRGDGVQARHIPEILAFIAEKDRKPYHIWGIEEPENSLSVGSALALASRLCEIPEKDRIQIFLTTHSPAFYTLGGPHVKKYFLKKVDEDVRLIDGSNALPEELMEFMGENFYLPTIANSINEAQDQIAELNERLNALRGRVEAQRRPLLFLEGDTDEDLIRANLRVIDPNFDENIEIVNLGGANHAKRLGGFTETLIAKLLQGRAGYVLLDSDKAGRDSLPNGVSAGDARQRWVKSLNNVFWRLLPPTAEAQAAYAAAGIIDTLSAGVCLEDCYSADVRDLAFLLDEYELGAEREFVRTKSDMSLISAALAHEQHKYYLYAPGEHRKRRFTDWLLAQGMAHCEHVQAILLEIYDPLRGLPQA